MQNGNSSKKKQNKKKQAKQSEPDIAKVDHVEKDSEHTVQPIQNGHEGTVNVNNPQGFELSDRKRFPCLHSLI